MNWLDVKQGRLSSDCSEERHDPGFAGLVRRGIYRCTWRARVCARAWTLPGGSLGRDQGAAVFRRVWSPAGQASLWRRRHRMGHRCLSTGWIRENAGRAGRLCSACGTGACLQSPIGRTSLTGRRGRAGCQSAAGCLALLGIVCFRRERDAGDSRDTAGRNTGSGGRSGKWRRSGFDFRNTDRDHAGIPLAAYQGHCGSKNRRTAGSHQHRRTPDPDFAFPCNS